jgi:hypothetical protein
MSFKKRNEHLKRQRDSLQRDNEDLKNELEQTVDDDAVEYFDDTKRDSMQKEVKLLKQMIRTIEEKNLKEKNLLTKKLQQKSKEIEHLKMQCEKLRINERHLQSEIRSLNSQLRIQQRSSRSSLVSNNHHRSSSLESFRGNNKQRMTLKGHTQMPRNASSSSSNFTNFLEKNRLNLRMRSTSPAFSKKSNLSPSTSIDSMHSNGSIRSNSSLKTSKRTSDSLLRKPNSARKK